MNTEPALPIARPVAAPNSKVGQPRTGLIVRLCLLLVAGGLACVFAVALWLNPYQADGTPRTMATHTQLGMPPCNFILMTGKPCPACGMTTSFSLLVRGDVAASLRANWAGTATALLWAVTLVWAAASGIKGKPLFVPRGYGEVTLTAAVGVVLVLMLTRWGIVLLQG
jgi:hypothetical protein